MTLRPVVVLALALLVPVLCMDMKTRCELRDQLWASRSWRGIWKNSLATVICEVEKFVNQSLMSPTMFPTTSAPFNSSTPVLNSTSATPSPPPPSTTTPAPGSESSSEEDSSEEGRGRDEVGKYLQHCVVTNGTSVKVDGACLGMRKVFVKIYLNAGEECKKVDPTFFFQDCPKPGPAKPNSDESKDRPKPKSGPKPGKKPRH